MQCQISETGSASVPLFMTLSRLAHMAPGILHRMTNIFLKWLLEQLVRRFGEISLEIRAQAEPFQLAPISTSQYGGSERCAHGGGFRETWKDEGDHAMEGFTGMESGAFQQMFVISYIRSFHE